MLLSDLIWRSVLLTVQYREYQRIFRVSNVQLACEGWNVNSIRFISNLPSNGCHLLGNQTSGTKYARDWSVLTSMSIMKPKLSNECFGRGVGPWVCLMFGRRPFKNGKRGTRITAIAIPRILRVAEVPYAEMSFGCTMGSMSPPTAVPVECDESGDD